jgi:hypothetical protein
MLSIRSWFLEVAEIRVWYLWSDGGMENHPMHHMLAALARKSTTSTQPQPQYSLKR